VCTHILAAWQLVGHWDLLAVCEDLPEGLKEKVHNPYLLEQKRLLHRSAGEPCRPQ